MDWRMHGGFVLVQLGFAVFQVLTKLALTAGISRFVFPVYRNLLAVVAIGPPAFFLEKNKRTALSPKLIMIFFILGFTGVFCNQFLYLVGLEYTSATFAAAIQNAAPAFTFALAVLSGIEAINLRHRFGLAKLLGTFLSICGALVMTMFRGPHVISLNNERIQKSGSFLHTLTTSPSLLHLHPSGLIEELGISSWQFGAACLVGTCITWAIFLTLQASVMKSFVAPLSVSTAANFCGLIQLSILAVICVGDKPSEWSIEWGPQLIGVLYAGVVASGVILALQTWCIHKGGPVLAAVYQPVETLAVALLSFAFVGEDLYLGSLVGGMIIVGGLYLVAWGQAEQLCVQGSSRQRAPLLENPQVLER